MIVAEDPSEPFRSTPPQEVLGAYTEELDRRFHDFPDGEKTKLIESMRWEDKTLQQYMEKNRLAKWIRSAYEYAQQIAAEEADAATQQGLFVGGRLTTAPTQI